MMPIELVALGASWGGLHAIETVLGALPVGFHAAIVIAQHRQIDGNDGMLEQLLDARCALTVSEAEDKQQLAAGRVLVAPADYHMLVEPGSVSLSVDDPLHYSRPSIDVLLGSAADAYGERAAGVVLTGANADGALGLAPHRRARRSGDRAGPRDRGAQRDAGRGAVGDARGARARARDIGPALIELVQPAGSRSHELRAHRDTAILLVDDHDENLLALEAILEPTGYRLVRARSGDEALRALLRDEFAAILLDVQMPGIDGFETAALIRARERTRGVPIIFVTAISTTDEHVFRGYDAGAVDYLFKPIDPVVLRSKVEVFGELYERGRALAQREELLRAMFEDAPIGMARADGDGRLRHVNRALEETVGRDAPELIGRTLDELGPPADAGIDDAQREQLLSGQIRHYEVERRLTGPRGTTVPVLVSVSLARSTGGGRPDLILQLQDLRERRRAQRDREQLIRARVGARARRGRRRAPADHAVDRDRGARRRGPRGAAARAAGPDPRGARCRPRVGGAHRRGARRRRACGGRRRHDRRARSRARPIDGLVERVTRRSAGRVTIADVPAPGIDASRSGRRSLRCWRFRSTTASR